MDFFSIITIFGGLALFLYGMNVMATGLQRVAGSKLETIIEKATNKPIKGILVGAAVTALIQSSSATTVMVVGFVNSGLMKLSQVVGVIMGANIGTTFTAWIVSLLGFKIDSTLLILPLIGLSIPLLFSPRRKARNWGEMILGFALLFIAIGFLKNHIPQVFESDFTRYLQFFNSVQSG